MSMFDTTVRHLHRMRGDREYGKRVSGYETRCEVTAPFITACPLRQSERFEIFTQLSHDAAALAKRPAQNVALLDGEFSFHVALFTRSSILSSTDNPAVTS